MQCSQKSCSKSAKNDKFHWILHQIFVNFLWHTMHSETESDVPSRTSMRRRTWISEVCRNSHSLLQNCWCWVRRLTWIGRVCRDSWQLVGRSPIGSPITRCYSSISSSSFHRPVWSSVSLPFTLILLGKGRIGFKLFAEYRSFKCAHASKWLVLQPRSYLDMKTA